MLFSQQNENRYNLKQGESNTKPALGAKDGSVEARGVDNVSKGEHQMNDIRMDRKQESQGGEQKEKEKAIEKGKEQSLDKNQAAKKELKVCETKIDNVKIPACDEREIRTSSQKMPISTPKLPALGKVPISPWNGISASVNGDYTPPRCTHEVSKKDLLEQSCRNSEKENGVSKRCLLTSILEKRNTKFKMGHDKLVLHIDGG